MVSNIPLYEWLSHPLIVLIVGALISSYLIPMVTRRWQDHQQELQLKSDLVRQISESVTSIVVAVQFAEVGAASQTQEDYDKAYREWETKSAVIGSSLRAYFPNTQIGTDWNAYSEIVGEVYALSATFDPTFRQGRLEQIRAYFPTDTVDWDKLAKVQKRQVQSAEYWEYEGAWFALRAQLLAKRDELVQRILNSRISAF